MLIQPEHYYTTDIVCPHCGHIHEDSNNYSPGEKHIGKVNCKSCGKDFEATRYSQDSYVTERV